MFRFPSKLLVASSLLCCWFAAPANAETKVGFRQLTNTFPVAVQRGVDSEVQVFTNFTLNETHSVFFNRSGLKMSCLEDKPIEAPRKGRGSKGTPFRFQVSTPAEQPPGVYEFRIATNQAVSSCGQLMVTDHPVTIEKSGDNQTPENAQDVRLPVAICGRCEAFEDVDCFRFEGKAGEPVTLEIFAQRVTEKIHSMVVRGPRIYLMDPILTLRGPNGQIVAQNDNFYGGDSLIACTLPQDGRYVLEVRDARFAGDKRYSYCVEIKQTPHVFQTFPMAIQSGTTADVQLVGHGLAGDAVMSLEAEDQTGWIQRQFETPRGRTNPVRIRISDHPQQLEREPNSEIGAANDLETPVGVNGRLSERDDIDFYRFRATKGKYYRFCVEARDFGSPLDSVLELYDANGKLIAEADDRATPRSKDSELLWKAPKDDEYTIAIRDLHDDGGERFVYHLRVEPAEPDFILTGEYYYAQLAPGTRMIWFAKLQRLNGFDGPVTIQVDGLPEGVEQTPVTIPKGMHHCGIILSAADDAPISAGLVRVLGRATITVDGTEKVIERQGLVTCEQQSSGGGQSRWPIETQLVGVTKPLDLLSVTAEPNEVTLEPGKSTEIRVKIERNSDYKDAVSLDMEFKYFANVLGAQLPPGVTMSPKSKARLTGKTLEGTIILQASEKALAVEKLPIAVVARVSITFSITTNYASTPILLTVKPKAEK